MKVLMLNGSGNRNLARNMVYVMKCLKAGRDAGIAPPVAEADALTNFVRREGEGK